MKIKRSKLVSHLIDLYDNFRMAEFMDQSVDCVDINICAMRMLCFRFERYGRTDAPSMWLTERGIKALEAVAQKGDPVAQSNLGQCYKYGLGVELDGAKAIEWFEKSAAQGYVRGVASLGVMLLHENSPEKANRGLALLRQAVDKGCAPAMCNLGLHLLTIAKTKKQYNEAKQLIYRSAESGVVEGYVRLCNSKLIDRDEIARCTRKAWEQGFDISGGLDPLDFSYGSIYGRDHLKMFSLPLLPIEKLKRKAEHDAVAKTYLAYLSLDGHLGLPLDHKLAKNQFEQAAKKGVAAAQSMLGECYYRGYGCKKDKDKAFHWFLEAAKQNEFQALGWLGYMYYMAEGCRRSVRKAIGYSKQAAALGNQQAQYNLALHYLGVLKGLKRDPKRAVDLLWPLACRGRPKAIEHLGLCYLHGVGVAQNTERGYGLLAVADRFTDIGELSSYVRSRPCLGYLKFYEAAKSQRKEENAEQSILKMLEEYDYALIVDRGNASNSSRTYLGLAMQSPDVNDGSPPDVLPSCPVRALR